MSVPIKSCFVGLSAGLAVHLQDPQQRPGFDHHRAQVQLAIEGQVGLVVDQNTVAGFLNGFLAVFSGSAADGAVDGELVFSVLGGICLLGLDAPTVSAGTGGPFVANLLAAMAAEDPIDAVALDEAVNTIRRMFTTTPDVAISQVSLAGFVLGVFYARQFLPRHDGESFVLIAAAGRLAAESADGLN